MRKLKSLVLVTTIPLVMVGCASTPKEEDLQQLSRAQLSELLPGHTLTRSTQYGRWASYFSDGETGISRAWGTWGEENATQKYTISQDGEMCSTFMGEADWSKPNHKYCSFFYTDQSGMYYTKTTENTWKSNRIGKIRKFEFIKGDKYKLAEN